MKKFWAHPATHFIVIMLVFAITGTAVARLSGPITQLLGVEKFSFFYWMIWIFVLFPIYQVTLLCVALIFCKYTYFREKQRKLFSRIGKLFSSRKEIKNT
jgi:uncharacterized BrkB/YihY/UPF0761 family membrane protein